MRLNRAREAYELAAETVTFFRRSPGHRHNLAYSLMYQAEAATLEGNFGDADVMLNEASIILEEGGFMALASIVRLQQAELYFAGGQLDASLREAQHVADAFAEQEALPQLARTALLQARIAATTGDISTARYLCDHALDIAQGQGLLDLKYRCDYLLGQIAERSGDLDAAARYYDRAVQGIDEVQNHLVLDERTSFLEDKGNIYQRAIILAIKRDNKDQALIYVEKAKSRVIGDYLRNNIDIRLRAGDKAGESILEDLAKLREEQAWYSSIVYEAENEANLSDTAIMRIRAIAPAQVLLLARRLPISGTVYHLSFVVQCKVAEPIHGVAGAHQNLEDRNEESVGAERGVVAAGTVGRVHKSRLAHQVQTGRRGERVRH